ncbi:MULTISPECIES: hypothetical protein [unclassified Methylobacterium]|uniref:hypothetical protein n=1 Tax=unclassified Methylobacterium TaxID=2615210 RepID=UPI00164FD574|nr:MULTISPECIES: hypothetical protein [unclassified Methylobacterium]
MMDLATFRFRATARRVALVLTAAALGYRIATVIIALQVGDPSPLLTFPFGAILPAVLLIVLVAMPPTRTREGLLMRAGAIIQLWLIILLPTIALYLALGFPVVFLVVEIFETRLPSRIRDPLTHLVVA